MRPNSSSSGLGLAICVALLWTSVGAPVNDLAAQVLSVSPPTLVYDGEDGVVDLAVNATRVQIGPRGTLLVSDWKRGGLFVVNAASKRPERVAPNGRGPGEFTRVSGFGWLSDTLWVSDADNQRITFFPTLGSGKPITATFSGSPGGIGTGMPQALIRNGPAIVKGSAPYSRARAASMEAAQKNPLLIVTRDGRSILDTVFVTDGAKRLHEIETSDGVFLGRQPFVGEDLWAASSNGEYVATVLQSNAINTLPSRLELRRPNGERLFVKSLAQVSVPRGAFERTAESLFVQLNTGRDGRRTNEFSRNAFYATLRIPRQAAPVTNLLVSSTGSVLIIGPSVGQQRTLYTVLTARGELRGTFTLPTTQSVCGFDDRGIWSLIEQPDGALHLVHQLLGGRQSPATGRDTRPYGVAPIR
jgi:hypothetical protein